MGFSFKWGMSEHAENAHARFKLTLEVDGKKVGYAELESFNKPFKYYYIDDVEVSKAERGKSYGSEIVSQINNFLDEQESIGLLKNAIDPQSPAYSMYEKRGWKKLKEWDEFLIYGRKPEHTHAQVMEAARNIYH